MTMVHAHPTEHTPLEQNSDSVVQTEATFLRGAPGERNKLTKKWAQSKMAGGNDRTRFTKFWKNCQEADKFYLSEYQISVPEGGNMIPLGSFKAIIDTVTNWVAPLSLDINVPPETLRARGRAERKEKWLTAANTNTEEKTPTKRTLVKMQGMYGIAWGKYEFEPSTWGGMPEAPGPDATPREETVFRLAVREWREKRNNSWPLIAEAVNPQQMIWDINSRRPTWVLRFYKLPSSHVKAMFPNWKKDESLPDGNVDFWEIWSDTHVMYMADGSDVLTHMRHAYGRLPYVQFWPQMGLSTTGNNPDHLYRGIGHGAFDLFRAETKLISQYVTLVDRHAWPTLDFSGPPGIAEKVRAAYDQAPGSMNIIYPGVSVEGSDVPTPPKGILDAMGLVSNKIEDVTISKATQGQRPGGSDSGFHSSVLIGTASLVFDPIKESTQRGLQEQNEIYLRIVENVLQEELPVYAASEEGTIYAKIGPDDIRGHYINIVRINTTSPEERERKLNLWSNLWREGFVPLEVALRKAGIDNPLEIISMMDAEKFKNSDIMQAAWVQLIAGNVPLLEQAVADALPGADTKKQGAVAENILKTQGALQLPNAGNFPPGNAAGGTAGNRSGRVASNATGAVLPGGFEDMQNTAKNLGAPGPTAVPGTNVSRRGVGALA